MHTLAKLPHRSPMMVANAKPPGPTARASRASRGSTRLTANAAEAINAAMPTSFPSVACAAAALAVAACGASGGTPDEELPGLVHAAQEATPAIDPVRAAKDPAILAAAIDMPEHQ